MSDVLHHAASNRAKVPVILPSPGSDDDPTPKPSYEKGSSQEYVSNQRYMSTTDEDELLNSKRTSAPSYGLPNHKKPPGDVYFPAVTTIQRRRSANRAKSPLADLPIEPMSTPEEWDYSETAWWGWVVLIVTWTIFVMGIGSCFEIWSWAWDVGETPYAPPELEDDPTLPIVGYYPALIILTGVMAWVWVVIAWVGMKYFRHAKIPGDDT